MPKVLAMVISIALVLFCFLPCNSEGCEVTTGVSNRVLLYTENSDFVMVYVEPNLNSDVVGCYYPTVEADVKGSFVDQQGRRWYQLNIHGITGYTLTKLTKPLEQYHENMWLFAKANRKDYKRSLPVYNEPSVESKKNIENCKWTISPDTGIFTWWLESCKNVVDHWFRPNKF